MGINAGENKVIIIKQIGPPNIQKEKSLCLLKEAGQSSSLISEQTFLLIFYETDHKGLLYQVRDLMRIN